MKLSQPAPRVARFLLLVFLTAVLPPWSLPAGAAGSGSVRVDARPDILLADGHSTATIRAVVRDSRGDLVADGTQVRFTTTAGTITELELTSEGSARATLTSSALPVTAEVSAFAEGASATVRVQMVASLTDTGQTAPVISVDGKYVAYSEALRIVEAMDRAEARYQGLRVEANALQVDLSNEYLRAQGSVTVSAKEKSFTGERLLMNLRSLQLTLLGREGKHVLRGRALEEVPKPYPVETESFDTVDLSESEMLWTADRATAVLGQKVQLRKATAYWIGARVLPLSYHEIRLDSSAVDLEQYVGVGTEGLVVDLPYFLQMSPGGSTALRLRHQHREGFGWYGTDPGWHLDLERKYGVPGKTEGTLNLSRLTGQDWGMHWDHTHLFGPSTRLYTFLEYPAHRDLYGQLNLYRRMRFGSVTLNLSGNKLRGRSAARNADVYVETNARPIGKTGVRVSVEGRVSEATGYSFETFGGQRFEVPAENSREVGLKLRPPALRLGPKTTVGTAFSLRQVWGSTDRNGLSPVANANLSHGFGRGGQLSLNYNYNGFTGSRLFRSSGKHSLSGTFFLGARRRLRLTAFGMMGLDSPVRSFTADLSYRLTPSWRVQLQRTMYRFRAFDNEDLQVGLSRKLGEREVSVFWSQDTHRFTLELGVNNF